jgi:DNA polymerase III gamma/tau subunit
MKANKVLKRIAKIESLMSDVMERYSASAPPIRELLRDAKAAITRAKKAVQASSTKAKHPPVKHSQPTSKATPEPSKPKRRLSAAGRKAISEATKKRWAAKRAAAKKLSPAVAKKTAVKKVAAKKATPVKAAKAPAREIVKAPANKAPVKAAKPPARKVATKAPVKKAAVKTPAKKAVRVVHVATTPAPPTTEATTVTTPEQAVPESSVPLVLGNTDDSS